MDNSGSTNEAEADQLSTWIDKAAAEIDANGVQDKRVLLFELQDTVERLSQFESDDTPNALVGSDRTVEDEINKAGSLLAQFAAAHHQIELKPNDSADTDNADTATASNGSTFTPETNGDQPTQPSEDEIRKRVIDLLDQGVSSVSRIANRVLDEFEGVDRDEVNEIVKYERTQWGEMETRGDVEQRIDELEDRIE